MPFIEAPTNFYLGRRVDPQANKMTEDVVYYDSRDLTTHAVVVGMTGSGKTGLCITLLEEAILDNIPAIIIDPKGDITNLLLTFPDLRPEDFEPWVNVDDARRAGLNIPEYAADVAQTWRDGLTSWGVVPDRLRWLQRAAQYSIYTPGSDAGLPISILASLAAPRDGWVGNEESLREKINGITTALLALIGLNVEPVKDKEHVLIANIFENAWRVGQDLTLEEIILQVQNPPFNKLGAFPIDKYISEKERLKLAVALNSIIAAPSFQSWITGQSMDIQRLLYQPNGRPKVSIFYTAHLSEAERMFIMTLLLENLLGWMRTLSGTTSLRALLYIDELFGYFPPYPSNPPTKEPLLRLLKQARAFGVGLVLATQNPGDLDYKGLTNAGTWFIGRLQSDNDKRKIMDGLRAAATAQDVGLQEVEQAIADIPPRVFLMRNVHDTEGPIMVHTRWAMNYLRGPLTRQQVQWLMTGQRQQLMSQIAAGYLSQTGSVPAQNAGWTQPTVPQAPPGYASTTPGVPMTLPGVLPGTQNFGAQSVPGQAAYPNTIPMPPQSTPVFTQNSQPLAAASAPASNLPPGYSDSRPALPASTEQYFLPTVVPAQQAMGEWEQRMQTRAVAAGGTNTLRLVYEPILLAQATIRYQEKKAQIYTARTYAFHVPEVQRAGIVHWEEYQAPPVDSRAVAHDAPAQAAFGDLPPGLTDSARLTALKREVTDMLYNTARLIVPFNPDLGVYGDPDGDLSVFESGVGQSAREQRDAEIDKLTQKYASQMEKLEEKYRRKELELKSEQTELSGRKRDELFTTGEAVLGLLQGRTAYTLSRMSMAQRLRKQTRDDLTESQIVLKEMDEQMDKLQAEFEQVLQNVNNRWAQVAAKRQEYPISPLKKDIYLELYGIGWVPYWYALINGQPMLLTAFR